MSQEKKPRSNSTGRYKTKDISGQRFGKLVAIRPAGYRRDKHGKKISLWYCECDCSGNCISPISSLTGGHTMSCGCVKKETLKINGHKTLKDLTGQRFGKLTVIGRADEDYIGPSGSPAPMWKCVCDCNPDRIIVVEGGSLRKGKTKSCGCLQRESAVATGKEHFKNLTGQKFGELTVIREADPSYTSEGKKVTRWWVKCSCGREFSILSASLLSGHTLSCGHLLSRGERAINDLLLNESIQFDGQYSFDDLKGDGGNPLRFDFAILDEDSKPKYLIEYDGEQHFGASESGWNTPEHYKSLHRRDELKNNYCQSHSIPLIRIPYTHFKDLCIDDLRLETTKFRVV